MRLEYVQDIKVVDKCGAIGTSQGMLKTVRIEMEYLPECSKNSYKLRDGTVKRQVRDWMDQFSFMLKALVNSQGLSFALPLKVRIDGVFADRRSTPDLHNLGPVIMDSVEDALGINDRYYNLETGQPEVGGSPRIIVTISSEVKNGDS